MYNKIGRRKLFSKAKPKKPKDYEKIKLENLEKTGELLVELREAAEHWGEDQNSIKNWSRPKEKVNQTGVFRVFEIFAILVILLALVLVVWSVFF
jgi:hypothetical protein